MSLTLDNNSATYQIRAFKIGSIQVNETVYTNSLIVAPDKLITDWRPQQVSELKQEDFTAVLTLKPAIFIIGTGATLTFPPIELYGELINHGIGVEVMDTSAACRTYNVLSAEGRNVMAALLLK